MQHRVEGASHGDFLHAREKEKEENATKKSDEGVDRVDVEVGVVVDDCGVWCGEGAGYEAPEGADLVIENPFPR